MHSDKFNSWLNAKKEADQIKQELIAGGVVEHVADATVIEFVKFKNNLRRKSGFKYFLFGAFISLLSCVLTLLNPVPALYYVILYGLTSLGLILIFAGLYFLFE